MPLITNIYVDGFNFYYRVVKNTPYKWLDFSALGRLLLPKHHIQTIKYFTAQVSARPYDPDVATRQQIYLRALKTLPNLQIVFGNFQTNVRPMPLSEKLPPQDVEVLRSNPDGTSTPVRLPVVLPQRVFIQRTDEKGSDVNLAAHLLLDGFQRKYEVAVVISDDSDLAEPIRMVRHELGLKVGILSSNKRPSRSLAQFATFYKRIRQQVLAAAQFAPVLTDHVGSFQKPPSW